MAKKARKANKVKRARRAKKVYVVACEAGFRVYPPAIVLTHGDTFKIVNITEADLVWRVTDGPFGKGPKGGPVAAGRESKGVKVPSKAGLAKYDYEVTVASSRAQGNSDPMIIIDPEP